MARGSGRTAVPPAHAHDFLQIVYVEAGEHSCRVGRQAWLLAPGDLLVIPPGVGMDTEAVDFVGDTRVWTLYFSADVVDTAAMAALASWRAYPLLAPFVGIDQDAREVHVPAPDRSDLLAQLTELGDELSLRHKGYLLAVRALLTLILVRLVRLTKDGPPRHDHDPVLAAVFDAIEHRYNHSISLSQIATTVSLSNGHLNTVVKRHTGRTVVQWITERRMREARRLLANTDLTIAEVAVQVGYHDAGYFIRRFRSHHDVTPRTWRSLAVDRPTASQRTS